MNFEDNNQKQIDKLARMEKLYQDVEKHESVMDKIEAEEEEDEFRIRTKYIPVKPMSVEEAILQMNLLGHQFFVFRDAETEGPCVVYRRKDGDYGLIVEQA